MEKEAMRKTMFVMVLAALLLAACGPTAVGYGASQNSLSVTGVGQVSAAPDIAYISIGVRTESEDVSTAVARNADQVEDVMAALAESGVAAEDMQTNNFSVYSNDQFDFEGQRTGSIFYVDNTVYVTVRELSRMGDLLDDAVSAGANSIWGVQFDLEDRSAAEKEARDMALADAQTQAEDLASVAELNLGDVVSLSYTPSGSGYYYPYGMGGGGGGAAETAATSIVPGMINVSVSVYLSYEIK
jgi:uncharacterized protein YggE